jgi:hypothetical protein
VIDRFLLWFPCFASHLIRVGPLPGIKYLLRKYLLPKRYTGAWWPGVFLHKFYSSDIGRDPHNHPFKWSISFILTGGYLEWRFDTKTKRWAYHLRRPWSFNIIRAEDFHKAQLLDPERGAWTLFIAWQHKTAEPGAEWGFWDLDNDRFVGWKDYLPAGADGLEGD